jgi:hypothetical protein
MKGSKSETIGGISFWLAIILLVGGLIIGKIEMDIKSLTILGLIGLFILYYIVSRFKFMENLKIRETIYKYRDFKQASPDFSEDRLCRLTLKNYYQQHNLLIDNSDEKINFYIDDLFKNDLNLKYICMWLMEEEYPKYSMSDNSHNLSDWREKNKDLEGRVEYYIGKIPNL